MEKEIKELQDKLDALKLKYEKSKQPFKDGDVANFIYDESCILKITNIEKGECYGISNGKWGLYKGFTFKSLPHLWQLSTPEKWLEVCTNEAVKLGFGKGCTANNTNIHNPRCKYKNYTFRTAEFKIIDNDLVWQEYNNDNYYVIMRNGIWAEVIKDKTLEELTNEWLNSDLEIHDFIKTNPEAYIKAIQNLKK